MSDPSQSSIPESSPFDARQRELLRQILPGLNPTQAIWLSGYLAALGGAPGSASSASAPAAAQPGLTILYGTESGNAEALADTTVKSAQAAGFKAKAVNMADSMPAKIAKEKNLLVIVSTWGEGDPPETATDFHEVLMGDGAPRFDGTRFAVCGLGDTSYEEFCKMGKDFDSRLEALGGRRIADRADCDVDYDEVYEAWARAAIEALHRETRAEPAATVSVAPAAGVSGGTEYGRQNPFRAPLRERILLNDEGSLKETYHVEFDLDGSGLEYLPGDSLAVLPVNAPAVVDALIAASGLRGSAPVKLKQGEFSLRTALSEHLDITGLSAPVMKRYAEFAKHKDLDALLGDGNRDKLAAYLEGREIVDLLGDFPAKEITADELVGILRKLPPRLYSIASSPKAHPGEVHLTVGAVRYTSHGRRRLGVCSTYLGDRLEIDDPARVYVNTNNGFRLPEDPDTPIIMVGPGTGIAPFRAFIEERVATGAAGRNWLFFGDQRFTYDFLYQTEWQGYLDDGALTRLDLAFSRDQPHKVYVQDRMLEAGRELFAWLEEGAHFYVCGDANRMAHDVDAALHTIVAKHGGMDEGAANAYVKRLKSEKRYLRDVY